MWYLNSQVSKLSPSKLTENILSFKTLINLVNIVYAAAKTATNPMQANKHDCVLIKLYLQN